MEQSLEACHVYLFYVVCVVSSELFGKPSYTRFTLGGKQVGRERQL